MLDLTRVFLETSNSCALSWRHQVACALGWVARKVPPPPGADTRPQVWAAAEKMATTVRTGTSRAYREQEATRLMAGYILDLLRFRDILPESEHCIILHGASEVGC